MIRPLERRDKAAVLDVIRRTAFFTPDEIVVAEELIDVYLDNPNQKDYDVVVIESDGGAVGGYMTWGPTPMTDGSYDIYWMAVSPESQGRGLGRELVGWAEERVRSLRGRLVLIETSSQPKYHPTRAFYERLGYAEVARIPDFYRDGDDRVTYVKRLAQPGRKGD